MKTFIRKRFFLFVATMLFVLPFVSLNNNLGKALLSKTKAEHLIEKYIYVDLSLNEEFMKENSKPIIRYFDGEYSFAELLPENEKGIFCSASPIPLSIFAIENYGWELSCFDGSYKTNWNSDMCPLKDGNYNYICLDIYVEGEYSSIKGYGYFGNKDAPLGSTYLTQRIWLNDDNKIGDIDINQTYHNVIGYYDKNNLIHLTIMSSIINVFNGSIYYYSDIPEYVESVIFMRMSREEGDNGYIIFHSSIIDRITYGACYCFLDSKLNDSDITTTLVNDSTVAMLHLVIESYLTYGTSNSNGCTFSTIKNLFVTWFAKKNASKEELKNEMLLDYTGFSSNGNSYIGLEKNHYFSVNEKWITMCTQVGINPDTGDVIDYSVPLANKEIIRFFLIFLLSIIIVGGFAFFLMFYRRRKLDE